MIRARDLDTRLPLLDKIPSILSTFNLYISRGIYYESYLSTSSLNEDMILFLRRTSANPAFSARLKLTR